MELMTIEIDLKESKEMTQEDNREDRELQLNEVDDAREIHEYELDCFEIAHLELDKKDKDSIGNFYSNKPNTISGP